LRFSRVCSAWKAAGAAAPAGHTSSSPSSTVPAGNDRAAAITSGKRSVTSSSPRDQIQTWPPRRTSWARMPSYFHSSSQSPVGPSEAGSACSGWARKNG
jgi:hypothetical protein